MRSTSRIQWHPDACLWTGWLKVHHPQEFYAASLLNTKVEKKKNKHHELMRDAAMHGIDIRPPHPKHSGMTWKPAGKSALRAGWTQIPDIGPAKAEAIMSVEPKTFPDIVKAKGIGPKTLDKILALAQACRPVQAVRPGGTCRGGYRPHQDPERLDTDADAHHGRKYPRRYSS